MYCQQLTLALDNKPIDKITPEVRETLRAAFAAYAEKEIVQYFDAYAWKEVSTEAGFQDPL